MGQQAGPTDHRNAMRLAFLVLAGLNIVLLAIAFFYQAEGEDPAGRGLRMAFALAYALALIVVLLVYRFVGITWLRVILLVVLTLPVLTLLYGIALWL